MSDRNSMVGGFVDKDSHCAIFEIDLLIPTSSGSAVGSPPIAGVVFDFLRFRSFKVVLEDQRATFISVTDGQKQCESQRETQRIQGQAFHGRLLKQLELANQPSRIPPTVGVAKPKRLMIGYHEDRANV